MPEKNFEQQVRDTLGELQINPADEVWMNVKEAIQPPVKKWRAAWLWLSLPILATGIYFLLQQQESISAKTDLSQEKSEAASLHQKAAIAKNQSQQKQNEILSKNISKRNQVKHTPLKKKDSRVEKDIELTSAGKLNKEIDLIQETYNQNHSVENLAKESQKIAPGKKHDIGSTEAQTIILEKDSRELRTQADKKDGSTALSYDANMKTSTIDTFAPGTNIKTIKIQKPKWQKGFSIFGGFTEYSEGINLFKTAPATTESFSAPANNITSISTITQHPSRGYHYGAGFVIRRNYTHFSLQSGLEVEHIKLTNIAGVYTRMYTAIANAATPLTQVSANLYVLERNYNFTGLTMPTIIASDFINGQENALGWFAGMRHSIHFTQNPVLVSAGGGANGQYSSNPNGKKGSYQPSVLVGLNYHKNSMSGLEFSPYLEYNLRTIVTNVQKEVHLYKAGISARYFFR